MPSHQPIKLQTLFVNLIDTFFSSIYPALTFSKNLIPPFATWCILLENMIGLWENKRKKVQFQRPAGFIKKIVEVVQNIKLRVMLNSTKVFRTEFDDSVAKLTIHG